MDGGIECSGFNNDQMDVKNTKIFMLIIYSFWMFCCYLYWLQHSDEK